MKYLKYFETGYYYHDPFHEASKKLRIILHILGWELSELKNSIHLNLDCNKIPYSILYLLLINNKNIDEAYPIIKQEKPIEVGQSRIISLSSNTTEAGLSWNNKEIKFILQNKEPTKLNDIYRENGIPKYYVINGKTQYEIINSFKEKLSLFLDIIKYIGTLSNNYAIANSIDFTDNLKNSINEFIDNPTVIPKYLTKTIYDNIKKHRNAPLIFKKISQNNKFLYKELEKVKPDELKLMLKFTK